MMNVYAENSSPERIHVHFDKNIYNRGETVWYKTYVLQSANTSVSSKNIYMEWYGADGRQLGRSVAPIVLSTSSGSFDIPDSYEGENIEVRVFTRWMMNDDSAFLFRRELRINNNKLPTKNTTPILKTTVSVFPEGGFLIQGLRSRIAFKASNSHGNPVFIKAGLIDDATHTVDSIYVEHDGMGSFFLTPLPGHSYRIVWVDEYGGAGYTLVPVMKDKGAQLTIIRKDDKAMFRITRSEAAPENFEKMTLLVHMNRIGLYQVAINTTEKHTVNADIPTIDLPTGLLQFTLFTSDWIPVAERVMFINNGEHQFEVDIKASQVNLEKRGKNVFDLYVPDTSFANMSLAITDAALTGADNHTIFSDFFLSGEIKGKVFNPAYYFSGNTVEKIEHLDLVMLTNGWRRFDWDKIKAQIGPAIKYAAENEYMKVKGRASGIRLSDKTKDLNMIIVGKDSSRQFALVGIQSDGSFEYPITFFDTAAIVYSINNNPSLSEKLKLDIQNGLLDLPARNIRSLPLGLLERGDSIAKQQLSVLLAEQEILRKNMLEATLEEVVVKTKVKTRAEQLDEKYASGFFMTNPARKSYQLDLTDPAATAVTSARNILEFLMNRIPGLNYNAGSLQWRGNAPVLYLDEMPVDLATIRDIPLLNIAMVKAFPPIFMFAAGAGAGGAVAVYTRRGNDHVPRDLSIPMVQSIRLAGYTRFKEFYSPDYEQADSSSKNPDVRTTLYWNPHVITNKLQQRVKIEFFNNDFTKSFKLVLEGINDAGRMVRIVKTISAN